MKQTEEIKQNEQEEILMTARRRMELGLALIVVLMALLTLRLFYIQLICHDELGTAAVSQQTVSITGLGAGELHGEQADSNSEVEHSELCYALIERARLDERLKALLAEAGARSITKKSESYEVYELASPQASVTELLSLEYGAYMFSDFRTCAGSWMEAAAAQAAHGSGSKGITVSVWADAAGKLIPGLPPRLQGSF